MAVFTNRSLPGKKGKVILPGTKPRVVVSEGDGGFDATEGGGSKLVDSDKPKTTGAGSVANARVRQAELDYKIKEAGEQTLAANAALARQQAGADAQAGYLRGQIGTAGTINPGLLASLEAQRGQQQTFIGDQYKQLTGQLDTAYNTGRDLTTEGFGALQTYLNNNPATAFRDAPRAQAGVLQNDLAAYMQAQGVNPQGAQPGLAAANTALEGGAANYNNLLGVLQASEQSGQESRLAEQQMGQRLAFAQLIASRAQQAGTLTTQQMTALQEIQTQYNSAKFNLDREAQTRKQTLEDALASLYGTGSTIPPPPPPAPPPPPPNTAGFRKNSAGALVANLGNQAPGYKPPTAAQKASRPVTGTAPAGTHWEWNGAKWVPVPNK